MTETLFDVGDAVFSADGRYRYLLTRTFDSHESVCTFVMLNPSTATASEDDPTIRRCIGFARSWEYGRLEVVNLYAYRATDPGTLRRVDDPVGPENNRMLAEAFGRSWLLVAAWGAHAKPDRVAAVAALTTKPWLCLGVTQDGSPRHPLYLARDTQLWGFTPGVGSDGG